MRRLTPSARLLLGAAFYLGVTTSLGPLWSEDLWWHLRTGELIAQQHAVPHADPFSYTRPGASWVAHEWGYEVLVYGAYAAGGWLGIIYLKAVLVGLTALLAMWLALRWGSGLFPALLGATLLGLALGPWVNARPQMLDPLYLLVLLHLLTSFRGGRPRALWWMVPLFLLWANTHGTFVMGWALVGMWGVWEALASSVEVERRSPRPLVLPLVLSVAVCLVNPNGLQGLLYPLTYVMGENAYYAGLVSEFASPNFHEPVFLPLSALLFLTVLCMVLSPKRPNALELVLVLGASAAFLQHVRNGPLLAVFCTPVLGRYLSETLRGTRWAWLGDETAAQQPLRPAFTALVVVMALYVLALGAPRSNAPEKVILLDVPPTRATEVIRANHLQGNMFNVYEWGGYLIWNLWPEYKVFVDGRADVYGHRIIDDYREVYRQGPLWRETLRRYDVEWLLLKPGRAPATALAGEGEYVSIYQDDTAELFVRQGGPNQRLIDLAKRGELKVPAGVVGPRR